MDYLHGKTILVFGGTSAYCEAIFRRKHQHLPPSRIAVLSQDEFKHHEFRSEFSDNSRMRWSIRNVCDRGWRTRASGGLDSVMLASATKQVDTADDYAFECIVTNLMSAEK